MSRFFSEEAGGYQAGIDGSHAFPETGVLPTPNEAVAASSCIESAILGICIELFPVESNAFLERSSVDDEPTVIEFGWTIAKYTRSNNRQEVVLKRMVEGRYARRHVPITDFLRTQLTHSEARSSQEDGDDRYVFEPLPSGDIRAFRMATTVTEKPGFLNRVFGRT